MAEGRRLSAAVRLLQTPEGVELGLTLADTGQRLWAFLIDQLIIIAALALLTVAALLLGLGALVGGSGAVAEVVAVLWLVGGFVLRNGWFILWEAGRHTATPGKRLMKIRVAARDGSRLSLDAVVARNLLRELEFFLPLSFLFHEAGTGQASAWAALAGLLWSLSFALLPLFNRDRLRVGDLVAGTWVLRSPRPQLGADMLARPAMAETGFRFTPAQLDAYGEYELQTLERVLRAAIPDAMRRPADDPVVVVAAAIRARIGHQGGDDYQFLSAYYAALRARLERGLLMGRRRLDKDDA